MTIIKGCVFLIIIGVINVSCNKEKTDTYEKHMDIQKQTIEKVANNTIFFGHQSVGRNILSGVESIVTDFPDSRLSIMPIESISDMVEENPTFIHAYIGENTKALTKFEHFKKTMLSSIGKQCNIACMKLCYTDIGIHTDVENVFGQYKSMIDELERYNTETTFLHFTVPLTEQARGLKPLIKKVLGRPVRGFEDNLVREKYNRLLRFEYAQEDTLFDLAYYESLGPDGARHEHKAGDTTYYSLVPEYTSDGGHLNNMGSRYIAEKFLMCLSELQ